MAIYNINKQQELMDFFNDDFGLGDSPRPKIPKNTSKKSETNKSIKGGDDFDDLLDQLLVKQKKKQEKNSQKQNQIGSLTSLSNLDKNMNIPPSSNQHKKWDSTDDLNTNLNKHNNNANLSFGIKNDSLDLPKNYEPIRNRPSSKSIYDEKGSEDNRSVRSGATARASFTGGLDNLDFLKIPSNADNNPSEWPSTGSLRGMMKPPLRKRNQSKMDSQVGHQEIGSFSKIPQSNIRLTQQNQQTSFGRPPLPKKQYSPPQKQQQATSIKIIESNQAKQKPQVIQKQKIVYVQPKNLRQQFDKQLKIIKQSHQRQVTLLQQQLQKQVKNGKEIRSKLSRQFEQQRSKDKQLYEMLSKKDAEKLKDVYEWQIKRKSQSYQLQIQRLKKLSQLTLKSQSQSKLQNKPSYFSIQSQRQQLRYRQKQLQTMSHKLEDRQSFLTQKQRVLETRQYEFDQYRKRQEQKLHQQKKNLYKMQAQLHKRKNQLHKTSQQQKISVSTELAKQQFQLTRKRQQLKLEKQQFQIAQQLFERQKKQYEEFNNNIMRQYKRKIKQLEEQKQYCQQKQIELYKKIQTVEMMADLKAGKRFGQKKTVRLDQNKNRNGTNMSIQQSKIERNPQVLLKSKLKSNQNQSNYLGNPEQNMSSTHNNININYHGQHSYSPSTFQLQAQMQVELQNLSKSKSKQKYLNNKSMDNQRRSVLLHQKSNLKQYLLKANKNKQRMKPQFL